MVTGDSQEEVIIFRDPQTAPIIYKSSSLSSSMTIMIIKVTVHGGQEKIIMTSYRELFPLAQYQEALLLPSFDQSSIISFTNLREFALLYDLMFISRQQTALTV